MLTQDLLCADGVLYEKHALNFLNSGALKLSGQTNLESLQPAFSPLYTFFLSTIYFVFGHNLIIVRIIQAILSSLTCLIIYAIAKETCKEESIAKTSAIIMALYYPLINAIGYIMTETLFVFCLASIIWLLIKTIKYHKSNLYLLCGICWGLAVLCRSVIWGFIPILIIYLFYTLLRQQKANLIKSFLIFIFGILLIIIPWSIRNYKTYGIFTPVFGGGYVLYMGNNPLATGGSGGWHIVERDARIENDVKEQISRLTPSELDALFRKRALEFIMNNPKRFIILSTKKFINMWQPYYSGARLINKIIMVLMDLLFIFPLSIIGMIFCRRKKEGFLLFYLLIGYYLLIHMLLISVLRYRLPIIPFLIIFSACALNKLLENWHFMKPEGAIEIHGNI